MKILFVRFQFLVICMAITVSSFAKGTISGKIFDSETQEPIVGASILISQTNNGCISDYDGSFRLNADAGSYKLEISFIGYLDVTLDVNVVEGQTTELEDIKLKPNAVTIGEVSVFASMAIQRKTPVALSSLDATRIAEKIGTLEFPEVLQVTPGVYATKEGGGYGDGRVNVRGFSSANVAVMINGVPVNDMEWGGIYWSNWVGLAEVTRTMQVQRGLGASKVAVPSVGGSINIITNTTDTKKGGAVSTSYGNDGYRKVSFSASSGLNDKGWAFSLLGSKTWGNGYILGTEFEAYSYFFNLSKIINNHHRLSLTGFGAPQWHNQRSSYDKKTIEEWQEFKEKYRFNATYGFGINGQRKTSAKNFYHKPQISLNHYWTINTKSSLSTSLYYSFGNGGGYTSKGNESSRLYGSNETDRTIDGYLDYAAIMQDNASNLEGSQAIIASSNNGHQWMGLISTYSNQLTSNIDFYGGIDSRYYIGEHNRTIVDLMGGQFFVDPERSNVTYQANNDDYLYEKLTTDDIISRNYTGHVLWNGAFSQVEYNKNNLSVFLSGAISNTTYWRYDKMYYAPGERESDKINFLGWSGKGGANYNINAYHNIFTNIGYFSRAPFYSSVFLATNVSNEINQEAKNEKVFSIEVGYGFKSKFLSANLNGYYTKWIDKTLAGSIDSRNPNAGSYNAQGVNAIHKGVELEAKARLTRNFTLNGMLSIGDWKWEKDVTAYVFNKDGQLVNGDGEVVTSLEDAKKYTFDIGGVHVGDAAQTTAAIGGDLYIMEGLKIGLDYKYFARLYADPGDIQYLEGKDTWKVPDAGVFDMNASYSFDMNGFKARVFGNVHNLLDTEYISDADSGSSGTWTDATVFYGFGRTFSVGLKINF